MNASPRALHLLVQKLVWANGDNVLTIAWRQMPTCLSQESHVADHVSDLVARKQLSRQAEGQWRLDMCKYRPERTRYHLMT